MAETAPVDCGGDVPPSPPIEPWTGWRLMDDISHLVLGALYLIVLGASIYMRLQKTQNLRLLWQITFFIGLVAGILMRAVWCFLQPFVLEEMIAVPNLVNLLMQTIPSFLFFSCYLIILFLWAEIYHTIHSPGSVDILRLRPIYFGTQGFMYAVVIVLELVDRFAYPNMGPCPKPDIHTPMQRAIWFFDASLYLISALGFLIYGGRFYFTFSRDRKPLLAKMRNTVLPKVKYLTIMLSICFLIRGGMTLSNGITNWTNSLWWIDLVYYAVLEVLPIVLMLLILRPTTQQALVDDDPINSQQATDSGDYA